MKQSGAFKYVQVDYYIVFAVNLFSFVFILHFRVEGEKGVSKLSGKQLHYKGAPFHRIIKDFMIQGGDFTAGIYTEISLTKFL